jgi:hypothetical protein
MQKATIAFWQCRRAIEKTWGLKPKVVYWIYVYLGGETHFDLRCLTLVEKASQIIINRKTAHLQRLACVSIIRSMHSTPTADLEVILKLPHLGIYIEGEARQATDRLNCFGEFTRARFGHSEVFEKITDEWPSLLAPGDKIVPIIAFGRGFLVELPPRSSWLSQETSEIRWCDFLHRRFTL